MEVKKEEMTVARGLSELKLLDARINRVISDAKFINVKIGGKLPTGFKKLEDVENRAKSDIQSSHDLISRRNKIKSAIVVSNAVTYIEVANVKMTKAEAIERKTSIEYDKTLLRKMKSNYAEAVEKVDKINHEMKERLDSHLETLFGKEGKTSASMNEDVVKLFKSDNEAELIDTLNLHDKIVKLEKEIEDFENEVDFALSESNVMTKIQF